MAKLLWDQVGERTYETGVDHGVLFLPNNQGVYDNGYAWNGLVTVTESPSGAESTAQYADNIKYLSIQSAEELGGTIEAFTYPDEFAVCDGTALFEGIGIGQQPRKSFGLAYRTILGNDVLGNAYGYKIHLLYSCLAAPSERAYGTVNDSPEPITFSWEFSTTPVPVGEVEGVEYKPTSILTIPSVGTDPTAMAELLDLLYGTPGTDPQLPTPAQVLALFAGTTTVATPTMPTYNSSTKVITIPTITGVSYYMDNILLTAGAQAPITSDKIVEARPNAGYKFPAVTDKDWLYDF